MLCQPNEPEHARITDDVTFRRLCSQTDICIENIVNLSVLLRIMLVFIVQVMMHR